MLANFRDFCTWMYVVIDDLWQPIAPLLARPGPEPVCSDSELVTLAIVGECRGWDRETELLSAWRDYADLFPHLPERSRFNRRRRALAEAINLLRGMTLRVLDVALAQQVVIDSLPVPVVSFHLAKTATRDWAAHGATYGRVASKSQTIYGYKLHLVVTVGGVILNFHLAPANAPDHEVGFELLEKLRDVHAFGDKADLDAAQQAELAATCGVHLHTLPRRNQHRQVSAATRQLINQIRQIIETVNGQLTQPFQLEVNHAHSFAGLCARLSTKLAAHTLCIYLNRQLGVPDWLQIKRLAFPI